MKSAGPGAPADGCSPDAPESGRLPERPGAAPDPFASAVRLEAYSPTERVLMRTGAAPGFRRLESSSGHI
ncbi:MAG: hypothetical protein OXG62_13255 [Nitrospinae bacterium]|nr:hypothetical protein [Nitrospinota bacterium]